jgi:hypothetical protein
MEADFHADALDAAASKSMGDVLFRRVLGARLATSIAMRTVGRQAVNGGSIRAPAVISRRIVDVSCAFE